MAIVYLHIGAMKTGTSYLQAVLGRNRDKLREDGVLFPGRRWGDQIDAVRDVLDMAMHGHLEPRIRGSWRRMVDEIHGWPGRAAVVSMELLSFAEPEQVRTVLDSLAPSEVRVVLAARDLARVIPASWQEAMQNLGTWTWEDYLAQVLGDSPMETEAGRDFWKQQDLPRILRTWGEAVTPQHVHLVIVPPPESAPDLLWRRFCTVLDLDPQRYDLDVGTRNESLGVVSAELMRRVNIASRQKEMAWPAYERILKQRLAKNVLTKRKHLEPRLGVPADHAERARMRAHQLVDEIKAFDPQVVGELDELLPTAVADGARPEDVTDTELLDVAVDGMAGLGPSAYEDFGKVLAERDRALASARNLNEATYWYLVKRAGVNLGERNRPVGTALRAYRWMKHHLS